MNLHKLLDIVEIVEQELLGKIVKQAPYFQTNFRKIRFPKKKNSQAILEEIF